jgi:serine/threonine protein kinase
VSEINEPVLTHLRRVVDAPDLEGTRYALEERLGEGGMGVVYCVHDPELDRHVALKVLAIDDETGSLSSRLAEEARHLARLEHPNIVPVHDMGRLADGRMYYTMKLVRGVRLDEWAKAPWPRSQRLQLFLKICEALAFAHARGVIHRDLKPANVMVGEFGEALVLDWGLAKAVEGAAAPRNAPGSRLEQVMRQATARGSVLGTPSYMAPEQARGEPSVDERVDVFALGVILHGLLKGAGLVRPLASIVERATAADREARYGGVSALADDVNRFLAGLPVSAHRESFVEVLRRHATRHQTILILVTVYLLMRLVVLLVFQR